MPNGRGAQGEAQRSEPLPALRPVRLHPSRLLEGAAVPLRGGDRRRGAAERGVAHPRGDAAVRLPEAPGAACGVRPRHRARPPVLPAARGRDAGAPQALPPRSSTCSATRMSFSRSRVVSQWLSSPSRRCIYE